jgi:hypothetical protein
MATVQRVANPARKARSLVIRLSEIEHRRINQEALRRGLTVADLTRSVLRVACGALPVDHQERR